MLNFIGIWLPYEVYWGKGVLYSIHNFTKRFFIISKKSRQFQKYHLYNTPVLIYIYNSYS